MLWVTAAGTLAVAVWCGVLYAKIVTFGGVPSDAESVRADVGIVLGASLWDEVPSPALKERLDYAIKLYDQGMFSHLIVTGGKDKPTARLSEAEGSREYLIAHGVPDEAIAMDKLSRDTYENLLYAKDIMSEQGWHSAVIVTHSYHGSRAADMARTLDYSPVQVQVTDSEVLKIHYHEAREVLAYTKWLVRKMFL
ncbi:YdcF family protein [Cohnella yongneupensis]|uniref:YdcF family protein n=1 Tax=Cohnella yongneupensis TaxID=425006 RepID=A0ABW0R407_9BACL